LQTESEGRHLPSRQRERENTTHRDTYRDTYREAHASRDFERQHTHPKTQKTGTKHTHPASLLPSRETTTRQNTHTLETESQRKRGHIWGKEQGQRL